MGSLGAERSWEDAAADGDGTGALGAEPSREHAAVDKLWVSSVCGRTRPWTETGGEVWATSVDGDGWEVLGGERSWGGCGRGRERGSLGMER